MIFETMQMCNFRGFFGETPKIRFSSTAGSSVTLIHAVNGGGKTATLNALTWALYDSTTFDKGPLVNRQVLEAAQNGENVTCWVELSFRNREHGEDVHYFLRREASVRKSISGGGQELSPTSRLVLQQKLDSGGSYPLDPVAAQDLIDRIIPPELTKYFFFEGESPARLSNPNKEQQKALSEATKRLLGVEVLDRTIRHLDKATSILERELARGGSAELQESVSKKNSAVERLEDYSEDIKQKQTQVEKHKSNIDDIRKKLADSSESRELEHKRRSREADKKQYEQKQIELRARLKSAFSKHGSSVMLANLADGFQQITTDLRNKGELPSGIKRQFIDDLLSSGVCICGQDLGRASIAREKVLEWRERAGLPKAEEKVIALVGFMSDISDKRDEFLKSVQSMHKDLDELAGQIEHADQEIVTIGKKLIDSNVATVAGLEKSLESQEEQRDDLLQDIGRRKDLADKLAREVKELTAMIEKLGRRERANKAVSAQIQVAKFVAQKANDFRDNLSLEFKEKLEKSIQNIYSEITVVPYHVIVNDDFSVDLRTKEGGHEEVDPSKGENQVLSLAFLGGIINETREYYTKVEKFKTGEYVQYPIVMDAPFGQLDPGHRRNVAYKLSKIADQVIVLVTPTQYRGEVQESIEPLVGRQYLMRYYTTRKDFNERNQEDYQVEIQGGTYNLVELSQTGFDYSEIVEI